MKNIISITAYKTFIKFFITIYKISFVNDYKTEIIKKQKKLLKIERQWIKDREIYKSII